MSFHGISSCNEQVINSIQYTVRHCISLDLTPKGLKLHERRFKFTFSSFVQVLICMVNIQLHTRAFVSMSQENPSL